MVEGYRGTIGCFTRTKFWSWMFCFSPQLTTGPNSSEFFFHDFRTAAHYPPQARKIVLLYKIFYIVTAFDSPGGGVVYRSRKIPQKIYCVIYPNDQLWEKAEDWALTFCSFGTRQGTRAAQNLVFLEKLTSLGGFIFHWGKIKGFFFQFLTPSLASPPNFPLYVIGKIYKWKQHCYEVVNFFQSRYVAHFGPSGR